ncbi:MAG: heat-inducible transcription repressor HrcA [Acidimicrobiia bacterium]|nr:heat-inducible transcription repressor HrcA [Acidimicrobiia bacterium]
MADMLDDRKIVVLQTLIEQYIATGEPVSSAAIAKESGLAVSTATIRNDLTSLEAEGYLLQPHTSAGRLPTAKGYRYYVDHSEPGHLRRGTQNRINSFFSSVQLELSRLLKATTELVADETTYPAVVLGPGLGGDKIRGVHVVQTGTRTILVVLVTVNGQVSQDIVSLRDDVQEPIVSEVEGLLGELVVGHSIPEAAARYAEQEIVTSPATTIILDRAFEAVVRSDHSTRQIYVGGTARMASVWEDVSTVNRVLEVLEREATLLALMISTHPGTSIRIGEEIPGPAGRDLAVVSSSYELAGGSAGSIGVVGPMAMDYRRTIKIIEEVRDGLVDRLGS